MDIFSKKMKAVEIRIPCKQEDFQDVVNQLSHEEREFIMEMEQKYFTIDTITVDSFYSHAFIHEDDLNRILDIYRLRQISFDCIDITEAYNKGENINVEFKIGLDDYLMNLYTVDDVLDKITKVGMECLNRVDLMILEKEKAG